jgi:hypothetical protein
VFLSGFRTRTLYARFTFQMRATCPANVIFDLIIVIIFSYKILSFSYCNVLLNCRYRFVHLIRNSEIRNALKSFNFVRAPRRHEWKALRRFPKVHPDVAFNLIVISTAMFTVTRPAVKWYYKLNYYFFTLAFYERLWVINVYSTGVAKSENILSDPRISDKGYRTVITRVQIRTSF